MKRWSPIIGCLAAGLVLVGCQRPGPILPDTFLPEGVEAQGPLPDYSEVLERYNAQVADLERVWSATDVEIRWRDDDGKAHLEKGDGKFLFIRPGRVALTVEKLGRTYLWAGADELRFWLFDNQSNVAYVGHHANVGRPCADPLPLPVHPSTLPYLLGLVPIDRVASPPGGEPQVERIEGHHLIEPAGYNLRLLLDPQTSRPVRVDLTDEQGYTVVIAQLSRYEPVALDGVAREDWPQMPTHAELYVVGREARMTLNLSRMSDGKARNRIRDAAFEFPALLQAHAPREIVELDGDCE